MARLEITGIEKELEHFLDTVDLERRASAEKTQAFVAAVAGGRGQDQDLYVQHGGKVIGDSIIVEVQADVGAKLLLTAKDTSSLREEVKEFGNKLQVKVFCTIPVCFTYEVTRDIVSPPN